MARCIYGREEGVNDVNNDNKVDSRGGVLCWAAVGGGKSSAVVYLPRSGVWVSTKMFFDITTNLWSDAFLAGRVVDFDTLTGAKTTTTNNN